jgi:hypothetical protein
MVQKWVIKLVAGKLFFENLQTMFEVLKIIQK